MAPYQGKEVTDKGVIIPDQIRQREALATVVAYVLKVGPLAYKDEGKFEIQTILGARKVIGFV